MLPPNKALERTLENVAKIDLFNCVSRVARRGVGVVVACRSARPLGLFAFNRINVSITDANAFRAASAKAKPENALLPITDHIPSHRHYHGKSESVYCIGGGGLSGGAVISQIA